MATKKPALTQKVIRRTARPAELVTMVFGGVTVQVNKPTKAQRAQRLAESSQAMNKLTKVISKPGVKLALNAAQPSYVADRKDPSLVVQTVGGVSRRGRFAINGRFVEVK